MDNTKSRKGNSEDDLFAGRGFPAYMSPKENAIKSLRERYSESFALTFDQDKGQVHLFMVKLGLWSLVFTFTKKDTSVAADFGLSSVLSLIEDALAGRNEEMQKKLDNSVEKALVRTKKKLDEFSEKL